MIGKIFSLFAILGGIGLINNDPMPPYTTSFNIENGVLLSVKEKSFKEIRIYSNSNIVEVAVDAFDGCSLTSIMVSDSVQRFYPVLSDDIVLNLTKNKEAYQFDIPTNVQVNEYACDEGFLNYWNENIRDKVTKSICNVDKTQYNSIKTLYNDLSTYDRVVINQTKDGTGTIKDSLTYLDNHFNGTAPSQMTTKEISQSVMISIILAIASFGMTAIGVFYVLKDKKVIN